MNINELTKLLGELEPTETDKKLLKRLQGVRDSLKVTQHESYQKEWIEKCAKDSFPPIVEQEIEWLLTPNTTHDIPRVMHTLLRIQDEGVAAVWDGIKPAVTKNARRICGTIFPAERIDAGRTMTLNMEYLRLFAAKQIAAIDVEHELLYVVQFARNIDNPQIKQAVEQYLTAHSYEENISKTEDRKEVISASERLTSLSGSITQMANSMQDLLGIFSNSSVRPVLGCEPPAGSTKDDNDNTTVPSFSI